MYWPGLLAWFQQDDFVWLNMPNQAHGWDGLLRTLFLPNPSQGSWRPLSERVLFLAFGPIFGADALPYRIWVFLTQFANLALAASITTRLTRSRAAGFLAAVLWAANSKLAVAMSWTSAYNQILCGFFLLLALHFFLRYRETGARRDYLLTWAVFLAGFLAMESNVIFPLLAATYALLCARKQFRSTLPFFAASALYGILHLLLAPNHAPEYMLHIDGTMPATLWTYWRRTFQPNLIFFWHSFRFWSAVELAAASVALLAFTVWQARQRRWLALVFLAWYLIALLPVIALRDHIMDYYLTLPAMCLAMLAALALTCAWRARLPWKALGVVLAAGFLVQSLPGGRREANWYRRRSQAQEAIVMGVAQAHELHPGKTILLDGVDDDLFGQLICDRPFLFLKILDVYLTPGSQNRIAPHPEWGGVSNFIFPADATERGLEHDQIVVYRVGPGPLRNITHQFVVPAGLPGAPAPLSLDLADPLAAGFLGPEWYGRESGFRWMPRTASLRMAAPPAGRKLYVTAICPAAQLLKRPLEMTLTVDGVRLPPVEFTKGGVETTFPFVLPQGAPASGGDLHITVEVSRTVRVGGDQRDLGLAVVRFEIK